MVWREPKQLEASTGYTANRLRPVLKIPQKPLSLVSASTHTAKSCPQHATKF
jgi:hypothetical protein